MSSNFLHRGMFTSENTASFEASELLSLTQGSRLFDELSTTDCQMMLRNAQHQRILKGQVLFTQGQKIEKIFLLTSGSVKLTHVNHRGSEVILAVRGPREVIDVPGGPRFREHHCAASVLTGCTALMWRASRMQIMMKELPRLNVNISSILVEEMHRLQQRFHEVSCENVEHRVASTLLRLVEEFGIPTSQGLSISISRHELAQMSATTLFTVSRLVSRWSELGLLLPRREAVLMLDPGRFRSLCIDDGVLEPQVLQVRSLVC